MARLQLGDKNRPVLTVQQALKNLGFDPQGLDGAFGTGTQRAVIAFQTAKGLVADGLVGDATWKALGLPGRVPETVVIDDG